MIIQRLVMLQGDNQRLIVAVIAAAITNTCLLLIWFLSMLFSSTGCLQLHKLRLEVFDLLKHGLLFPLVHVLSVLHIV
jgi:hypothetical protein